MLPERKIFEKVERDKLLAHGTSEVFQGCVNCSRALFQHGLVEQREYYAIRNFAFRDLRRRKKGGQG
jgi:hypothetical protein